MGRELDAFLADQPLREFETGETVIVNTYLQRGAPARVPEVGYVRKGLVRGAWHRPAIAPSHHSTVLVAGEGSWIGLDAFKYRENLFRYTALSPAAAFVFPLADLVERAPRPVLLDALQSASLAWCTAASVVSLRGQGLDRRAMLLLYNLSRLNPRHVLQVTQGVVAELVGISRQALNPVLKKLEAQGLVRLGYGRVTVDDPTRLIEELRRTARSASGEDASTTWGLWK